MSLWRCDDGQMILASKCAELEGKVRFVTVPLMDVQADARSKWFGWKGCLVSATLAQEVAKVVIHGAPIDGAECFWDLKDWQCVAGVSQQVDWLTKGLTKWQEMCRVKFNMPPSFFPKAVPLV